MKRFLFALIWFVPVGLSAQTSPVEMPPILIGTWNDHRSPVDCDARSETYGITITATGKMIDNDGGLVCQIEKLKVGESNSLFLGSWSYERTCTSQRGSAPRVADLFGRLKLEGPENGRKPVLHRDEAETRFGSFWDEPPPTRRMSEYRRCP